MKNITTLALLLVLVNRRPSGLYGRPYQLRSRWSGSSTRSTPRATSTSRGANYSPTPLRRQLRRRAHQGIRHVHAGRPGEDLLRHLREGEHGLRHQRLRGQRRRHDHRPRHGPHVVQGRQRRGRPRRVELGGSPGLGRGAERGGLPGPQRLAAAERQGAAEHPGLRALPGYHRHGRHRSRVQRHQIVNEGGQDGLPLLLEQHHPRRLPRRLERGLCVLRSGPGLHGWSWMDVHGAGAQRSDPKAGDPTEFPTGRGPQGDAIRSTTSSG